MAAEEPRFTAAAVYQPPTFGHSPPDIPETPEAPPALQALQALRGGLRRPGPATRRLTLCGVKNVELMRG